MQRNITDEKKESSLPQDFNQAVETLNQILALKDTTLVEVTIANKTEYIDFCRTHFDTYFKAIDGYLEKPDGSKWIEDCVKHCCAIPHKDTWRLLEKAIQKNMKIAIAIVKCYPNMIQLFNSAQIKLNLVDLMLEGLPPSYVDFELWMEKIRESSISFDKDFFLDKIKGIVEKIGVEYYKFNEKHKKLMSMRCRYDGEGRYVRRPYDGYEYHSLEYANLRIFARILIMSMLAHEKVHGTNYKVKWSSKDVIALLSFFNDYYLRAASIDDVCAIYNAYQGASFFNQPERYFSFFSRQYPTLKIEFIRLLQHELILKLNDTSDKTTEQLYEQAQSLIVHPLFSESHYERGVDKSEYDKLKSYLTGLKLICESMQLVKVVSDKK